jgi:hypothetical protein
MPRSGPREAFIAKVCGWVVRLLAFAADCISIYLFVPADKIQTATFIK